jgi:hypothetical protein
MITFIYCTREHKPEHIEHLKKVGGHPDIEVIEYINNGESLTKFYKKGLSEAKHDIIVFCHDDIIVETKQVAKKITKLFDKNPEYGIIGVAGTKYMAESGMWWEDRRKMYGQVAHTHEGKTWVNKYSGGLGNNLTEVVVVDGLFFSVHRKRIKEDFDLNVKGFHFYEIDFCFRNYLAGVKLGVHTNVRVNHMSIGMTNDEWENNKKIFAEKYKDHLPVKINRKFTGKENFNILISSNNINEILELGTKLKKNHHNVTVCSPLKVNELQLVKQKGLNISSIQEPVGYKLGDGKWVLNTQNGPMVSEVNKLYRISEVKFDVIHCNDNTLSEHFNKLYPEIPMVTNIAVDTEVSNIIMEYQEKIK